jgi:type IV pilus assembly protein PilM
MAGCAVESLPAGAVRPAPLVDNIADPAAVSERLKQMIETVADGQRRCVLVIPDLLARVALVELDHIPSRVGEAERLLRWRLRKDLPFDVDQAVLSYYVQSGRTTAHEVLAVVCLQSLVRQYEQCLEEREIQPGHVTLSTLAALDCLESTAPTPTLLVKRDHSSMSLAIVHGTSVRLFRTLPLPPGGVGSDEAALFEKIYPAVVYFQDQWGQSVGEIVLVGFDHFQAGLRTRLEEEAGALTRKLEATSFELPSSNLPGTEPDGRVLPSLGWARGEQG